MHQNILLSPDLTFPFSHSSRLLKTLQFYVFLSYEENRKQKRRFFPVMLLCKSSPTCVACSPKEVCNHWVWGKFFRRCIFLQLLLVSSFKIFLWQNNSHVCLVSEAATWKCCDCQEVLFKSLRNSFQNENRSFAFTQRLQILFACPKGIVLCPINRNTTLSSTFCVMLYIMCYICIVLYVLYFVFCDC